MSTVASRSARYAVLVLVPLAAVLWLLQAGPTALSGAEGSVLRELPPTSAPAASTRVASAFDLGRLVLQLVVVLAVARGCGAVARRFGQPAVIGEMFAGIALGPSLLGAVAPSVSAMIFPPESLGFLNALSQVGVLLFLFVVGLHVDLPSLRRQSGTAVIASHASIAAPFTLGVALAHLLFPNFAPAGIAFVPFALFVGVAMSVTAFPVLARILEERRMLDTPIGALAVACAAVDDVTAWILLAAVVAIVNSAGLVWPLFKILGGTMVFVLVMYGVIRSVLANWDRRQAARLSAGDAKPDRGATTLSLLIIVALLSAYATERLGIHALFGAFVAGTVVPREHGLAKRTSGQLGDLLAVLLLPLFFAYTGLRTDLRAIADVSAVWALAAVLFVAVAGKVGGTALAARASGQNWHNATVLGILMNTRGLMELVVLNIGLDLGVIAPPLFSIMVVMALVTTAMTVPVLSAFTRRSPSSIVG
jgi:Kef-type K+ transport system membrane component KefB